MRVLALVHDAFGGRGGIAKFNRDLLTSLAAAPEVEEVAVLPRYRPMDEVVLPDGVRWIDTGLGGIPAYVRAALRHGLFRRYDVIVAGNIRLLPLARMLRFRPMTRLVLVAHGIEAWQPPETQSARRAMASVTHCLTVSGFTRDRMLQWADLPEDRYSVVYNSVDLDRFSPGPAPADLAERYGLAGKRVLLTLARLDGQERYKGIDEVLEVLPALAVDMPDIAYLVAGDGDDRPRLEAKARDLGVADRVVFAGYIDEAEKVDHYRLADAFVMAGRGEGFGIVLIEAMACGIPTIASSLDASQEAVGGGEMGLVANPDDPENLKAAILSALSRPKGSVSDGLGRFSFDAYRDRIGAFVRSL